jgi:hypothetical protein
MRKRLLGLVTVATISSLVLLCPRGGSAADRGADAGGGSAGGSNPSQDAAAGAQGCMTDTDCAGTPLQPHCATGSMMPVCVACVDYAGKPCVPVACDGGLCDTSNGSACSVSGSLRTRRSDSPTLVLTVLGSVAMAIARRRGRHAAERCR